jgi:F-type H+-transporting ATPase subunit epsilon
MNLKVLLPSKVFVESSGVSRIVVETPQGSMGLLEHRRDCVSALAPGILSYQIGSAAECYVAVDEGALVKAGPNVFISVRRAIASSDLSSLRVSVEKEFRAFDERDQKVRQLTAKTEAIFLRRFVEVQHGD